MDLNKVELKEKVLCAFKNNTDKLYTYDKNLRYYPLNGTKFYMEMFFEDIKSKVEVLEKSAWFWRKDKIVKRDFIERVWRYRIFVGVEQLIEITEEEFLEVFKIQEEEQKEQTLKKLEDLCSNT
tara:strand:- start:205 stop:576 length:372 start_codon:yes stop_codon:yes gene_type:complete